MVNLAAACGAAIAAAVLAVVLRRYHAEYGLLISLGAGAVLLLVLLQALPQVFSQFQSLLQDSRPFRQKRGAPFSKPWGPAGWPSLRQMPAGMPGKGRWPQRSSLRGTYS